MADVDKSPAMQTDETARERAVQEIILIGERMDVAKFEALVAALSTARAEGRREGLREAAGMAEAESKCWDEHAREAKSRRERIEFCGAVDAAEVLATNIRARTGDDDE